jgi:hypothetical protein
MSERFNLTTPTTKEKKAQEEAKHNKQLDHTALKYHMVTGLWQRLVLCVTEICCLLYSIV